MLESLQTYIQFDREAMNAKDEAPNSPEVQDGKEPLQDTTSPTAAPETTSEPASASPEVEKTPAAEAAVQATDTTDQENVSAPSPSMASEASASTPTEPVTPASEQIAQQVKDFATKLIQQMQSSFSVEQKSTVIFVALVIIAIPAIVLANKVLNVIDGIPLLEPILELVGLAYTIWFVYRYLIFAQSRKELIDNITGIKSKILGDGKSA